MTEALDTRVYVMLACSPSGDAAFVQDYNGYVWVTDVAHNRIESSSVEAMQQAVRNMDFVAEATEHQTWLEIYSHLAEIAEKYRDAS